jgi:hypothetical protein
MKKIIFVLCLFAFGCSNSKIKSPQYIDQGSYIILLKDSIQKISTSNVLLSDSIVKLNKSVMNTNQFIEIYKYERLLKYYQICVNNPTQWAYYKGWSIRVFTEK